MLYTKHFIFVKIKCWLIPTKAEESREAVPPPERPLTSGTGGDRFLGKNIHQQSDQPLSMSQK